MGKNILKKGFHGGFSLVELLTTVTILMALAGVATMVYRNFSLQNYKAWTKSEMASLAGFLKSAKRIDGGYHQFIYQLGYKPKGEILATIGIPSSVTKNACCSKYTPLGAGCRTGFFNYNCKDNPPYNLTDNTSMCNNNPSLCTKKGDLSSLGTSPFSGLSKAGDCQATVLDSSTGAWCNCKKFTVAAVTVFGKSGTLSSSEKAQFSLNEKGVLCQSDKGYTDLKVVDR